MRAISRAAACRCDEAADRGVDEEPPQIARGAGDLCDARHWGQRCVHPDLQRSHEACGVTNRDSANYASPATTLGAHTEGVHHQSGRHCRPVSRLEGVSTNTRSSRNTLASTHCRRRRSPSSTRFKVAISRSPASSPSRAVRQRSSGMSCSRGRLPPRCRRWSWL